jgi:hypothetical protein
MVPRIGISYWHSGGNPTKQALFDRLREWCDLDVLDPEREHPALTRGEYDLYHMAKRRAASLLDLRRAATSSIPVLNAPTAARVTSDRVARLAHLETTGIPLPNYQFGRAETIDLQPPVVVKPRWEFGTNPHEFSIVDGDPITFDGIRLVEEHIAYDRAYKLYAIGDTHRAVEVTDSWTECTPPRTVTDCFDRVCDRFDLDVFEVDVAVTDGEPCLLDVNPAVSLRGIEDGIEQYDRLLQERCSQTIERQQASAPGQARR